jgi:hypothetical protein
VLCESRFSVGRVGLEAKIGGRERDLPGEASTPIQTVQVHVNLDLRELHVRGMTLCGSKIVNDFSLYALYAISPLLGASIS